MTDIQPTGREPNLTKGGPLYVGFGGLRTLLAIVGQGEALHGCLSAELEAIASHGGQACELRFTDWIWERETRCSIRLTWLQPGRGPTGRCAFGTCDACLLRIKRSELKNELLTGPRGWRRGLVTLLASSMLDRELVAT
jgi:hypothetical protein